MRSEAIRSVIRAYDDPIVRAYCWGRFWILRQRFLDEIGQYLPARGRVLDLGCGFGLFSLDKVMDPRTPVNYWSADELQALLEDVGFEVHRHLMVDVLPYPHVLYIGRRRS